MEQKKYSNYIGITENGDPCCNFEWEKKLQDMNLLITKELNDEFINKLIKNKKKIILHLTCTGNGGTEIEPYVPIPESFKSKVIELIRQGFPKEQLVLRIDPIILSAKYYRNPFVVIELFKGLIKRLRFSFLNMFSCGGLSYNIEQTINLNEFLEIFIDKAKKYYNLESCANIENENIIKNACISNLDLKLINKNVYLFPSCAKREQCNVPGNTIELLEKYNCRHGCKYCYLRKTGLKEKC